MKKINKWQLKYGSETITIIEKREDFFLVKTDNWMDDLTNSLWFTSYQSARRYIRKHMHVEGRFKKVENI
ncbi:hypothetical protein [Metabacillus fastidiosus]|uniref:hypothetical protein n=1 Tax=Metabacillus fastidiosus TaxID=1458 RepID=UPI003D2E7A17